MMRRQSCSDPNISLPGWMPALFIRISAPPKRSRTVVSSSDTSSIRLTSTVATMISAAPPGATDDTLVSASARRLGSKSAIQTFMPRRANRIAAARPMPDAPPVTTATLLADMAGWGTSVLRGEDCPAEQLRRSDIIFPPFRMAIGCACHLKRHGRSSFDATLRAASVLYGAAWSLYTYEYNDRRADRHQGSADMAVTQAIPIARHPYADGSYKQMLIDGKWIDAASGKRFETHNPATGELLATVAEGDAEDINRAVAAARRSFEGPWKKVKPYERQALLLKLADLVEKNFEELSQLDTLDMGAPISRTRGNKLRVLGMLRYYAGQATALHGETIENSLPGDIFSYTLKEPVGVVGAIIPWNGPLGASVWKIGPAIATGCTVILKPAEEAPLTSLRLAELAMEAGIPPGVVNVVPGYGDTAGAALASHPGVDKVAFTGSHVTGQSIVKASAGNLKRVSLELGGKSPDIVFADADLDAAVPGAAMAVFANSGQICSAGTRMFVEQKIYDEFVGRVAEFGKKLKVGNGIDPNTQIGPLVSEQQMERVSSYLDIGQKEGAKALAGGARLTEGALSKGYFVPPTVFANVQDNMRIAQEEIFGPVISAISFKDTDELIQRANATTFGLGSGVWTKDVSKAHRVAKALRAGSVWVNCYQAMDPAVPFGGYKMSGYGRESGKQHLEEYLNVKAVWIKTG